MFSTQLDDFFLNRMKLL